MPRQMIKNSHCLYFCIIVKTSDVIWLSFCIFNLGHGRYHSSRRPIAEDCDLHEHCFENLKYSIANWDMPAWNLRTWLREGFRMCLKNVPSGAFILRLKILC